MTLSEHRQGAAPAHGSSSQAWNAKGDNHGVARMAMVHDGNPCFRRGPKNKQTALGVVVTTMGSKLEF